MINSCTTVGFPLTYFRFSEVKREVKPFPLIRNPALYYPEALFLKLWRFERWGPQAALMTSALRKLPKDIYERVSFFLDGRSFLALTSTCKLFASRRTSTLNSIINEIYREQIEKKRLGTLLQFLNTFEKGPYKDPLLLHSVLRNDSDEKIFFKHITWHFPNLTYIVQDFDQERPMLFLALAYSSHMTPEMKLYAQSGSSELEPVVTVYETLKKRKYHGVYKCLGTRDVKISLATAHKSYAYTFTVNALAPFQQMNLPKLIKRSIRSNYSIWQRELCSLLPRSYCPAITPGFLLRKKGESVTVPS